MSLLLYSVGRGNQKVCGSSSGESTHSTTPWEERHGQLVRTTWGMGDTIAAMCHHIREWKLDGFSQLTFNWMEKEEIKR